MSAVGWLALFAIYLIPGAYIAGLLDAGKPDGERDVMVFAFLLFWPAMLLAAWAAKRLR